MDFSKIEEFLRDGTYQKTLSVVERRVLAGWRETTLANYNAAQSDGIPFCLPLEAHDIYRFRRVGRQRRIRQPTRKD